MEWILTILGSGGLAYVTAFLTVRNQKEILREELKLEYSVETAIIHLLQNPNYTKRGFKKIKHHLRGFKDDDDLRMALIRAGAVAFSGSGNEEVWGLLSRNQADIK